MTYDKKQVADRLCYWREFMQSFHLPTWEELPDLELYMDQVVSLVIRYVNLQPHSALKDSILTASAVNNYVRLKLIPPPVKKRYSRIHLAYLIVICCLKGVYEPVQHSADVSYEPVRGGGSADLHELCAPVPHRLFAMCGAAGAAVRAGFGP